MNVITLTVNPAIDVNTTVEQVIPEQKLRCGRPRYEPGGGGINVSRAVHKLGSESTAVFFSGGPGGKKLEKLLDDEGIKISPLAVKDKTRDNIIVRETSSDQQFRFGMPGPEIRNDEWSGCLDTLENMLKESDYLIASGSLPPGMPENFYARIAEIGWKKKARIIVDTSGAPLKHAVHNGLFLIKPNMRELSQLAGRDIETESQLTDFTAKLIENKSCQAIVVSLGAGGVFLAAEDLYQHIRTPIVPIKSKVGAGDSMVAGIVRGLHKEWPLKKAVQYGVAAGSAAVMTPGTELCRKKDTDALFDRIRSHG